MMKERFTTSKAEFESFEQKRRYPRIILDHRASLVLPGNQAVNVLLYDLSICAIQMRFDTQTEQTISSVLQYLGDKDLSTLEVRFRIKLNGREEDIHVSCNPLYIFQLDQDIYAMGMQFSDIDNRCAALIKDFVEVSMEPG